MQIIDVIAVVCFLDALSRSCKLAETWGRTDEIYSIRLMKMTSQKALSNLCP